MTKKTDEDRFVPKAGGRWEMVLSDGTRFLLRRPKLGEQRRYEELLQEMADDQRAARLAAQEKDGPPFDPHEWEARICGWWRIVVGELNTQDGAELPDDDDELPSWFLETNVIAETRTHWRSVPYGPGGSPTQAAARAQEQSTQQATRALEMLAKTSGGLGLQ